MTLSRRSVLAASLAAPAAPFLINSASAEGHISPAPMPRATSFQVGEMLVTTLLDGSGVRDNPQGTFGMNVDAETFATASAEAFISAETYKGGFTPVLVEVGNDKILFDTGLGQGGIVAALSDAGVAPEDITHVVLTHMHPDHIGGMTTDAGATFPNAAYIAGRVEYDTWMGMGENRITNMMAQKVTPFADNMTFIDAGQDVRSGITAIEAFGHTPGHMTYMIDGGSAQMLIAADLANHHVWSLGYPDWEVRFDADKEAAAASRRKILGMLATDRIAMVGYHMPFPSAGFIETRGDGFKWIPATYQFAT